VGVWELNGTQIMAFDNPGSAFYPWLLSGTAYFNGNGVGQIVWRNTLNGQIWTWAVHNSYYLPRQLPDVPSTDWVLQPAQPVNN
jgi:hypothetical protein